jgi:hypothetical protein
MNNSLYICLVFLTIILGISTTMMYSKQVAYSENQQQPPTEQHEREQLITYTNPQGNYTLQYPQSWKVEHIKPANTLHGVPTIQFRMPDSVSLVSIETSHSELSRKQFEDRFLTYYPLILRERFDGINIENKTFGKYEIDGYHAGSIVFSSPTDKSLGISKGLFVSTILSNNQTISITYISSNESYDNNITDIEAMIDSIRVLSTDNAKVY